MSGYPESLIQLLQSPGVERRAIGVRLSAAKHIVGAGHPSAVDTQRVPGTRRARLHRFANVPFPQAEAAGRAQQELAPT